MIIDLSMGWLHTDFVFVVLLLCWLLTLVDLIKAVCGLLCLLLCIYVVGYFFGVLGGTLFLFTLSTLVGSMGFGCLAG